MFGQPKGFTVGQVIPTEPSGATAPAVVVQVNDSVTLKTYLHVDASVQNILKNAIKSALTGAGASVEYHLQDLETGTMVPTITGGAIAKLSTDDIEIAFGTKAGPAANPGVAEGELKESGLLPSGDYYLSAETSPITTGDSASTATLKLATATSVSGSWRILAHAHGGAGSEVSAFDDNILITVIT